MAQKLLTDQELLMFELGRLSMSPAHENWEYNWPSTTAYDNGAVAFRMHRFVNNKPESDVPVIVQKDGGKYVATVMMASQLLYQKPIRQGVDAFEFWHVEDGNPPVAVCEIGSDDLFTVIAEVLTDYSDLKALFAKGRDAVLATFR